MKSVSLQRTYKDKDGNFQHATSFGANDMPKAVLALTKAYDYLVFSSLLFLHTAVHCRN